MVFLLELRYMVIWNNLADFLKFGRKGRLPSSLLFSFYELSIFSRNTCTIIFFISDLITLMGRSKTPPTNGIVDVYMICFNKFFNLGKIIECNKLTNIYCSSYFIEIISFRDTVFLLCKNFLFSNSLKIISPRCS